MGRQKYQIGRRVHRHRGLLALGALGVLLIVGCLAYRGVHSLTAGSATSISNAPVVTHSYSAAARETIQIDEPQLRMILPQGWSAADAKAADLPGATYVFRSPARDARTLAIYLDSDIPADLAINRVLPVTANGAGLSHDTVSDNCTTYTRPSGDDANRGTAEGKWQNVSFLCDLANYERNVVGIASTEGANRVFLTGPTTGRHAVFITYADNGPSPDNDVLYAILQSFSLK